MSTNLATILVGLGYDLSALEKGAPEAFRLVNQQTLGMSAEMKRSSREGAESLRLIDEALGIHLSRPLTRILTQEFPGLAKGLQSILGAGVVGALAVAGFELFDKIGKSIEKAQKAQEALKISSDNLTAVFAEEMASYKEKDKAVTAATGAVNKLVEAQERETKAAQEAASPWGQLLAGVGDFVHNITSLQSTLKIEEIDKQLAEFKKNFDMAALQDSVHRTQTAMKLLNDEITAAGKNYEDLKHKAETAPPQTFTETPYGAVANYSAPQVTPAEVAAAKAYAEQLSQIKTLWGQITGDVHATEAKKQMDELRAAAQAAAAAIEKHAETLQKTFAATRPAIDASAQLDAELVKEIISFTNLNNTIGATSFYLKFHETISRVIQDFVDLDVRQQAALQTDALFSKGLPGKQSLTPPALPASSPAAALPQLGAGGTAGAQFDVFSADKAAQFKLVAQAFQDALTPTQEFDLKVKELKLAFEGLPAPLKNSQQAMLAFDAEMQKLHEQAVKATDQLQKLLEKTGDVSAGVKAFFLQWQGDSGQGGKFAFDFLNKGLQGFEDETVKALTGGKTAWLQYFESLDQMALKFLLNKEFAALFKGAANSDFGKSLGLDKLLGNGNGGQVAAETANTTAIAANTAAVSALTGVMGAGGAGGAGGGAGILSLFPIPGFAGGTDSAPGGLSWVGENGPELMNVPTGASITPNSAGRGGSSIHMPISIDAKGAELGVDEKISRALSAAMPRFVARAVMEASDLQRRSVSR